MSVHLSNSPQSFSNEDRNKIESFLLRDQNPNISIKQSSSATDIHPTLHAALNRYVYELFIFSLDTYDLLV